MGGTGTSSGPASISPAKPTMAATHDAAHARQRRAIQRPALLERHRLGAIAAMPTGTAQNTAAAVALFGP